VAGAPGALAYRAVNTLDAMVGHHSTRYEEFGWASARADDLLNWLPARAGALAVAVARPSRAGAVLRCVTRDSGAHPSPNGGVIEAAFAGALRVRLGGLNRYGEVLQDRGELRGGPPAVAVDIRRAVELARDVGIVIAGSLTIPSLVRYSSRRRRGRCPGRSRFLPQVGAP
jgi:adenosylcobinamide-phosphate synthase